MHKGDKKSESLDHISIESSSSNELEKPFKEKKPSGFPKAVGFIVANEFCERFSYYGLRTVLSLYLRDKLGYSEDSATVVYHTFTMLAYFFPLIGAMIADGFWGRYKTILNLSMVYVCGTMLISLTAIPPLNFPAQAFTFIALLLIAIGTGGIKPCVSAFGGDQFKLPEQQTYISYFFSLFYFAINAGSLISTFLTPILRADVQCFGDDDCFSLAFGVPGILMICSLLTFVAGTKMYVMLKPAGNIIGKVCSCIWYSYRQKNKSSEKKANLLDYGEAKYGKQLVEDIKSLLSVLVLFIPLPVFWALFDQQGSRWTFQADRMYQRIGSWTLKADQMQVLNPLLILILIPIYEVLIYPFMTKIGLISKPLHRMIWGGLLAVAAFVISGVVELALLPTYGTPVTEGEGQLRIYNGFNCPLTLTSPNATIPSLGVYEILDIEVDNLIDLPYSLSGSSGDCSDVSHSGSIQIRSKVASSIFIENSGVYNFTDNNDKVTKGVHFRLLANLQTASRVVVKHKKDGSTAMEFQSTERDQKIVNYGFYDILINDKTVFENIDFETGSVHTLNVYETGSGYVGNDVIITPANSIHILWLIPQYLIITMAEVMFSITGLHFSFTQAPASMKSVVQAIWLLTVATGNVIVIFIVQFRIFNTQWKEFFLFAGLMFIEMLIFSLLAYRYKYVETSTPEEEVNLQDGNSYEQSASEKENQSKDIQK